MAHDLTVLRQARAMAVALQSSGVADENILDQLTGLGIDRAVAAIVVRQIEVNKAELLAANARRDIHYGLLTVGSAAVIFLVSLTLPLLPIVFGAAVLGGLGWMARGFFFRWRAERLAPGIYKGAFRELFGGHAGDMIKDPEEVLSERAAFAFTLKRAKTNALYFTYLLTGAVFLALFMRMSTLNDDDAFLYTLGMTFVVFLAAAFASFEMVFRGENLPPPRPFGKKTVIEANDPVQRYAAPHVSDGPDDNAVIFAPAHDALPAQSIGTMHQNELVFGVLNVTTQGVVFLPDAPVDNAELRAMGRVAIELAAGAHPALEALRDAVMEKIDAPDTLPQWMNKALAHHAHFVIAWSDLAETGFDPSARETLLVKRQATGAATTYKVVGLGNALAAYLFNLKLAYERNRITSDVALLPRYKRIEAELIPHFQQIHGETADFADELHKAVMKKLAVDTAVSAAEQAEIERRMQPLMPALESTPALVIREGQIQSAGPASG